MAGRAGVPVLAVAGRVALRDDELAGAGIAGSRALIDHARSLDEARRDAYPLLREQTTELVRDWLARRT